MHIFYTLQKFLLACRILTSVVLLASLNFVFLQDLASKLVKIKTLLCLVPLNITRRYLNASIEVCLWEMHTLRNHVRLLFIWNRHTREKITIISQVTDSLSAANYFLIINMKSKGLKIILMSIPRRQAIWLSVIDFYSFQDFNSRNKEVSSHRDNTTGTAPYSKKVLYPFSKSVNGKLYCSVKETTKRQ